MNWKLKKLNREVTIGTSVFTVVGLGLIPGPGIRSGKPRSTASKKKESNRHCGFDLNKFEPFLQIKAIIPALWISFAKYGT